MKTVYAIKKMAIALAIAAIAFAGCGKDTSGEEDIPTGDGSASNPWQIATATHLQKVASSSTDGMTNTTHYLQTTDIQPHAHGAVAI